MKKKLLIFVFWLFHLTATFGQNNLQKLLNKTFIISEIPTPSILDGNIQEEETKIKYQDFYRHTSLDSNITVSNKNHSLHDNVIAKLKFVGISDNNVLIQYIVDDLDDGLRKDLPDKNIPRNGVGDFIWCSDCRLTVLIPISEFSNFNTIFSIIIRELPTNHAHTPQALYRLYDTHPYYKFSYIMAQMIIKKQYIQTPVSTTTFLVT